jgi:hypothetical protein
VLGEPRRGNRGVIAWLLYRWGPRGGRKPTARGLARRAGAVTTKKKSRELRSKSRGNFDRFQLHASQLVLHMAPYTARAEVIMANYELFLCLSPSPCGEKLMSRRNDWHTNRTDFALCPGSKCTG